MYSEKVSTDAGYKQSNKNLYQDIIYYLCINIAYYQVLDLNLLSLFAFVCEHSFILLKAARQNLLGESFPSHPHCYVYSSSVAVKDIEIISEESG